MANEATKTFLIGDGADGDPVSYNCAAGTTILRGTLCVFSPATGTRTIIAHAAGGVGGSFAGICAADKDSADSSTQVTLWKNGIFKVAASGTIVQGDVVMLSSVANYVETSNTIAVGALAKFVGIAEDSSSGGLVTIRINK